MKKYPLSKKAMAVALATVIAATPFVTFGDTLNAASANDTDYVEMNYSTTSDLAERLQLIYGQFKQDAPDDDSDLMKIIDTVADFDKGDWEAILNEAADGLYDALNEELTEGTELHEMMTDFVKVFQPNETYTIQERIDQYIADYQDDFEAVFGDGFELTDLFLAIADVENYILENGIVVSIDNVGLGFVLDILDDINNPTLNEMRETLSGEDYGVTRDGAEDALNEFVSRAGTSNMEIKDIVEAFLNAAREVTDEVTPPSPPTTPVTPPAPTPPTVDDEETVTDDEGGVNVGQDVTTEERDTDPETNVTTVRVNVNTEQLRAQLAATEDVREVRLNVNRGENEVVQVNLPSQSMKDIAERNPNARVVIDSNDGSISSRASQIDADALREQLGGSEDDDVNVTFSVNPSSDTDNTLGSNNLTASSPVVEFTITASRGDQSQNLNRFTRYIERSIRGASDFNPDSSVVVRINNDGTVTGVPTRVDGNTAVFRGFSNSRYAVVDNEVTYTDVPASYWGAPYIEKLSTQMIFEGYVPGDFRPENATTRAEFASLITRSLGLDSDGYDGQFGDVAGGEWYADDVATASEYGIVTGYTTGDFAPNREVTREEAAAMIVRAMEIIDEEYDLDTEKSAADFTDAAHISEWAYDYIERLTQADLLEGTPSGGVNPVDSTKRAEVAAMLNRFLVKSGFLN